MFQNHLHFCSLQPRTVGKSFPGDKGPGGWCLGCRCVWKTSFCIGGLDARAPAPPSAFSLLAGCGYCFTCVLGEILFLFTFRGLTYSVL